MAAKFTYVKCIKTTNNNEFTYGDIYKMVHDWDDDGVVSKTNITYGITASLAHDSTHGNFEFELV